ncbi:MAG: NAD kinase [Erysipelotrichaceae bacterium]|nr:NAD kinase [Erysipelotrichaceae bacterium]MDD4642562.1 NAD kinase [Erysipelotrichaceae bacterium]
MQKYNVIFKHDEKSKALAKHLIERIGKENQDIDDPKTVFVIGGDGTFLIAVHHYMHMIDKINFVAIHTGTLGFFTDYQAEEIDQCIDDYLTVVPSVAQMPLLKIKIDKQVFYAVNEMRIENVYKTQLIDVFIDNQLFETFRGTGLCVSTQLGSTAYNRSLGGAIITDGLSLLQLTEITGIHHKQYRSLNSSLILPKDTKICLTSVDFDKAVMCFDHKTIELASKVNIECRLSTKKIRFAKYRNIPYLKRLKNLF